MEAGNGNDHRDGSLGVGEGEKEERERRHEHARRKDDELGGSGVGHDDEVLFCAVLRCVVWVLRVLYSVRQKEEEEEEQGGARDKAKRRPKTKDYRVWSSVDP